MPVEPTFSTSDILKLVPGLTYRQIDYWCSSGLIIPSAKRTQFKKKKHFLLADIVAVRVVFEMRSKGFSIQQLRRITRTLRENRNAVKNPLASHKLIVVPGEREKDLAVHVVEADGDYLESVLRQPGQMMDQAITIPLQPLSAPIREKAAEIVTERKRVAALRREKKAQRDAERVALQRAEAMRREAVG